MRFLLATRNRHKTSEISEILRDFPLEIAALDAFAGMPEVVEDQPTIEGNARKKASETARFCGVWTLADDTGLEVAALGGAPGVFSARYAGPGCDFSANNKKLLLELRRLGAENRSAVFKTVMALSSPAGDVVTEEGRLEGTIAEKPRGKNGFGYDPVFIVSSAGKTLAEMPPEEKNRLSHRARALEKMIPHLKKLAAGVLAAVFIFGSPVWGAKTEPGQETIWDEIMASQANRGLRLGSRYMDLKEYDIAEKEFLRAVMANPKDPVAHMMLGAAYYWTGKVDLALSEYKTSLELDPKNAQAMMLTGIALAWKGDTQGSYEAFKRAADLDPSRADIQMNLGSIEETLSMVPEAMGHFRKAVALDPKHPLYHFQLGMLYRRLGRDADAIESMRQALKLYGTFEDALLELGAADERRGDRKAAIHSFRKAVDLKSRDSVARFRLGRLYLLTGDRARAREVFAEAFHLTPEGDGAGLQLSVSFSGGKKNAPAPAAPSAAAATDPARQSNDPLDVFARNLERVPLEQGAVMQVDVAFVPKPKLVKTASSEVPSSLKRALEKAAGADGHSSAKVVRREFPLPAANKEIRSAQIKKVLDDLRETMKDAPPDADVRLGMNLTFTRLAEASPGGKGGAGRAESDGSSKVSYQPRQVGNDMGLWVIGTGWMALVEEVLPEAGDVASQPEDSDWWVSTGLGYAAVGEGQKSLAAFDKACGLDPKNELAFLGRGVASVMTGYDSIAVAAYEEVLKINPQNRPAREGLKWLLRPVGVKK